MYYSTFPWPLVMCVLLSCIIKFFFDLGCSIKMSQKLKIHTNYLQSSLILLLLKMIFGFVVVVVHLVVIFVVNKAKFSILFSSLYLI